MLDYRGEDMTVIRYSRTGTDEYGDAEFSKTEETVDGLIEQRTSETEVVRRPTGEEMNVDVRIYLRDTVQVDEPDGDGTRGSIIRRERTKNEYRVESAFEENNGLIRCDCTRL